MDHWFPIQVKQVDKAGRPDIDSFEAVMMREDRSKGFFVSFDYTIDAERMPSVLPAHGEGDRPRQGEPDPRGEHPDQADVTSLHNQSHDSSLIPAAIAGVISTGWSHRLACRPTVPRSWSAQTPSPTPTRRR